MGMRTPISERGSALASAMLLVAVMSLVALSLVSDLRVSMRQSQNMELRDQAHWHALGAREYSEILLSRLMTDPRQAFRPDAEWLQGPRVFPIDKGQLVGAVTDGNNCFNLNGLVTLDERGRATGNPAQQRRFEILLSELGLQANLAAAIAAQAVDWIDQDGRPVASGAEDAAYANAPQPYRTSNTLMAEREEMLALAAMTPAIYARIAPFVCTRPVAEPNRLNLNTLSPEQLPLLMALFEGELTRASAEAALLARPRDGFETVDAFWTLEQISVLEPDATLRTTLGLDTQYFEIEIDVLYAGVRYALREVVEIRANGRPIRLSQRYGLFS